MKLIIIKLALCLVFAQHITLAEDVRLPELKHFNLSAGTGYSIHLTNLVKSPVSTENGGFALNFNVEYFFNDFLGLSLESGRTLIYRNENTNGKAQLSSIPLILCASILSKSFNVKFGAGINVITSEINSYGVISKSNYIDITYCFSIGYQIPLVSDLYVSPVIEFNYLSDLKLGRIVPLIQFGIRL